MDPSKNQGRPGSYLGTEVDGKWWRRSRRHGLFARGNGRFWHDREGFWFLRYLTRTPIKVPLGSVTDIEVGTRHAGRWCMGVPILKILWEDDGRGLSSGFVVSRHVGETEELAAELRAISKMAGRSTR
jgi:hypothetical protein